MSTTAFSNANDAIVYKNIHSLVLRGENVHITIEESGKIVCDNDTELHINEKAGVLTIEDCASLQTSSIGSNMFGHIANVSGGSPSVFNSTSIGMDEVCIENNNKVVFRGRGVDVTMRDNTLLINAPESTMLKLNTQTLGRVKQVLGGDSIVLAGACAETPQEKPPLREHFIALDSARIERVTMSGNSGLQFESDQAFGDSTVLHVKASGSAFFLMPRLRTKSTLQSLKVKSSGAASALLGDNQFRRVDLQASGASSICNVAALHGAKLLASGASAIRLSVFAKEIVQQHVSGCANISVVLLNGSQ